MGVALSLSPAPIPPMWLPHLNLAQDSRTLHAAGHIHRVAPDVILWLLGPYHSGHYRSMVQPCQEMW